MLLDAGVEKGLEASCVLLSDVELALIPREPTILNEYTDTCLAT